MSNAEFKIPEGYMEDAKGRLVPIGNIHETVLLEDRLVSDVSEKWLALTQSVKEFKESAFGDIGAFLDLIFEKYGVKRGGKKGNIELFMHNGRYKLIVAVADHIKFGPEMKVGEKLIYECVSELSDGVKADLIALLNHVFAADSDGNLKVSRVLSLRRIKMEHPKWNMGMKAINNSIQVIGSKEYMRLYERNDVGQYIAIPLDIAAL